MRDACHLSIYSHIFPIYSKNIHQYSHIFPTSPWPQVYNGLNVIHQAEGPHPRRWPRADAWRWLQEWAQQEGLRPDGPEGVPRLCGCGDGDSIGCFEEDWDDDGDGDGDDDDDDEDDDDDDDDGDDDDDDDDGDDDFETRSSCGWLKKYDQTLNTILLMGTFMLPLVFSTTCWFAAPISSVFYRCNHMKSLCHYLLGLNLNHSHSPILAVEI